VTGSEQEAEDILQTLFLQLLRSGVPPRLRQNPKGYLYRAAINHALNAVRSRRRRAEVFDLSALEAAADVPGEHPHDAQLRKRLLEALATLNRRAVEMILLRYLHKCSEAEIGTLFGTSRGVVAVTLWRARTRLRRKLLSSSDGVRAHRSPEE
jgi:RNA polymerase sigma factor (sigma-70 family)